MHRPTTAHALPLAIIGRLPSNYRSVTDQLLISFWAIMPQHVIPTIGHAHDLVQAEIFFGCIRTNSDVKQNSRIASNFFLYFMPVSLQKLFSVEKIKI
jgi:hypothetical protein